jgi:hypothetical protein
MNASLTNGLNTFMKHLVGTDADRTGLLDKIFADIKAARPPAGK